LALGRFVSFALAALLAGCASFEGASLVPGQSTAAEVETVMGSPAEKRPGPGGETVYYYPRLPWGYATYAARIAPDGRLIALEQRLTRENFDKLQVGATRIDEVRDLLGPPYQPMKQALSGNDIWTYPTRTEHPTPKWFLVQFSPDGVLREKYLIDDPQWVRQDHPRGGVR
jgi:hypothetical protein